MFEAYLYELSWMLAALFMGVGMGTLTGIIPGFHVNNVALILLALAPGLLSIGIPLSAVAGIIVALFYKNEGPERKKYQWEIDEEMEEKFREENKMKINYILKKDDEII